MMKKVRRVEVFKVFFHADDALLVEEILNAFFSKHAMSLCFAKFFKIYDE